MSAETGGCSVDCTGREGSSEEGTAEPSPGMDHVSSFCERDALISARVYMLDASSSQSPQLGLLPPWLATSPTPRRKVAFLGTDFSSINQPIQCPHTSHLLCWVLTLLATTLLPSPARASIRQLRTALHHGAHDVPPASQPRVCSPASPAPSCSGPSKSSCA